MRKNTRKESWRFARRIYVDLSCIPFVSCVETPQVPGIPALRVGIQYDIPTCFLVLLASTCLCICLFPCLAFALALSLALTFAFAFSLAFAFAFALPCPGMCRKDFRSFLLSTYPDPRDVPQNPFGIT